MIKCITNVRKRKIRSVLKYDINVHYLWKIIADNEYMCKRNHEPKCTNFTRYQF